MSESVGTPFTGYNQTSAPKVLTGNYFEVRAAWPHAHRHAVRSHAALPRDTCTKGPFALCAGSKR